MDYSIYKDDVKYRDDITIGEKRAYNKYLNSHKRKHSMNRMANSRDTETGRVYKAERAWLKNKWVQKRNLQFKNLKQAQQRCNYITKTRAYKKIDKKGGHQVTLREKANYHGRGCHGWAYTYEITLCPTNGFNLYTLLHELAHAAGEMHHGREFRNRLLKLVSAFMGPDAAKELKKEFKNQKLKLGNHPKPYTFERWSGAREKMAAMRAKL